MEKLYPWNIAYLAEWKVDREARNRRSKRCQPLQHLQIVWKHEWQSVASFSHLVTAKDESFKELVCGLTEQCFLDY